MRVRPKRPSLIFRRGARAYERARIPPVVPDAIDAIEFRMDQQGLAQKDLVPFIGSLSKVSEVLARKRPLSLPMIRRLHDGLGIPADVLIGSPEPVEANVDDEGDADFTKYPLREMHERKLFTGFVGGMKELKAHAPELMRGYFRGVPGNEGKRALLRAPLHQSGSRTADEHALRVWHLCVMKKALATPPREKYRPGIITDAWLRDLAKLSAFEGGPKLAQEYLGNCGIQMVIEPHFEKTYLDGAALLHDGMPIVALTLRHAAWTTSGSRCCTSFPTFVVT